VARKPYRCYLYSFRASTTTSITPKQPVNCRLHAFRFYIWLLLTFTPTILTPLSYTHMHSNHHPHTPANTRHTNTHTRILNRASAGVRVIQHSQARTSDLPIQLRCMSLMDSDQSRSSRSCISRSAYAVIRSTHCFMGMRTTG
jgi:hypothetical protein